jgi:hypothetical protein
MAAIYSNGGNRWNILVFNFTKRDALSSVYKISMVDIQLYQHEWKLGKREIVWKHEGRIFPISTSVDITIYQYGKNVLYLFYNIAQRNIKKEIFRRFRVDIELYQHGS